VSQTSNRASLGTLFKTSSGGTPLKSRKEYYEGGDIPWLLSGEVAQGEVWEAKHYITKEGLKNSSAKLFPENTVLVAMYGATAGQIGLLKFESATNQAVCGIFPNDQFVPKYVYYFLLSKRAELEEKAAGNAQPNISQAKIRETVVPIRPRAEQQRIVAILDEAVEGIATAQANAEKNLQNARELIGNGYQSITDASGRLNWSISPVTEIAASRKGSMRTGPFGSQLLHSEFVEDGVAVLGIDNAVANEFRWDRRRYISEEKYSELSRYRVFPGDVLITIMGTCGRCAVVPEDIPLAINSKHLCCISLDPAKCSPEYLHAYFLYDHTARKYLTAQAKGSIMAGLNMGIISELPVRLPSLEQQRTIVSKFDQLQAECDRLIEIQARKLAALDELKKSLLHQAFSGRL
jgi:type I restriction enzyme S subunit